MKILNRKSVSPPPFKRTCPCTILPLLFSIFQILHIHLRGRWSKSTPPYLKKRGRGGGGGSELWCFILIPLFQFRKTFSDVFRESRKGALVWNWLNIGWVLKTLFQQTREWLNDWLLGLWIHRWQEVSAKILNLTFFQKDFTTAKPGTISVYI